MADELTCERFHDGTELKGPTRLVIENGVVRLIEPYQGHCEHHLVAPGLVDLQMNGWGDVDVADAGTDDLHRLGAELASLGTTTWLATLITAPLDVMSRRAGRLHDAVESGAVQGLEGIHLEGPFLGRSPGAHLTDHIVPADVEWLASLPSSVRLVTLAAETPNASSAIALLEGRGTRVSLGHSSPTREEFEAALAAGAGMVTHLFNGMSGIHHRHGGLALWAMVDETLAVGVIADMVHLSPEALRLAFLSDRGARPFLVSDSVAWRTPWAVRRGVAVVDGAPRLPDGTLAGSSTCLAEGVRRSVVAGAPLEEVLVAATSRPARLIGAAHAGCLAVGGPADLVIFDEDLHVRGVCTRLPSGRA